MLVLADRNFLGFDMVERCHYRSGSVVAGRSNYRLPVVEELADGSYCRICPSPALEARSSGSIPFGSLLLVTLP
jgi:hypothetical protein